MEPRLAICIRVENNRSKSIQKRGTWCPSYTLTAKRRHHFSHHRPSLYSVQVGILLYGLLTHGLILWLIGCKGQCWVGHEGCQVGAWLGFLVGETSRRCCGPWKHLKHCVWWGKGVTRTLHTTEKGPSRPPSANAHGKGWRSSELGALVRSAGVKQMSQGFWGAPAVHPALWEGAVWVTHCCKCSGEVHEDLSQQALLLLRMRCCHASEMSGEEPHLGLGLTWGKPPAALSCDGNLSTHARREGWGALLGQVGCLELEEGRLVVSQPFKWSLGKLGGGFSGPWGGRDS